MPQPHKTAKENYLFVDLKGSITHSTEEGYTSVIEIRPIDYLYSLIANLMEEQCEGENELSEQCIGKIAEDVLLNTIYRSEFKHQ
jgi:hypothetical protein